jgi:aspartate aminotransferase-like enzyme
MPDKPLLMVPGPTPCPDVVLRALSQQMINHRGPEYMALQRELIAGLRELFRTEGDCMIFPASGTGGLEAAIANVLSPGDTGVAAVTGAFGARFAEIAAAFGARVRRLEVEWGRAAEPEALRQALAEAVRAEGGPVKAVLLTHNETSTGVLNDVGALAAVAREAGALVLVDSISGLLTAELPTDAWGLDVVVAGSQKAWMIPPGLTFVAVGSRAWEAHRTAKMPRFYFDFTRMRRSMEKDQTPYTPALPQLFGLREALALIRQEGLDAGIRRHRRLARATRAGLQALGLTLFADPNHASNALTAVRVPAGVEGRALRQAMREQFGVVLAGGQGPVEQTIFRIGHLGWVGEGDILRVLAALERCLPGLGHAVTPGVGVAAAESSLAGEEGVAP